MSENQKVSFKLTDKDEQLLKASSGAIHSAQKTLSDLDRSIEELSMLVENLKKEAKYLEK